MFTQHKMLAYRNGKSAGRVCEADWHGPHRFTGNYHVVPVGKACVLHFESCIYDQVRRLIAVPACFAVPHTLWLNCPCPEFAVVSQWRNKFIKHREIETQKKKDIPFPFYRDSITLFQVRRRLPSPS